MRGSTGPYRHLFARDAAGGRGRVVRRSHRRRDRSHRPAGTGRGAATQPAARSAPGRSRRPLLHALPSPGAPADVGGDWYDVMPLPNRRHGVAIGDVVGHGVRAAAVMGQLRQALRVYAGGGILDGGGRRAAEPVRVRAGPDRDGDALLRRAERRRGDVRVRFRRALAPVAHPGRGRAPLRGVAPGATDRRGAVHAVHVDDAAARAGGAVAPVHRRIGSAARRVARCRARAFGASRRRSARPSSTSVATPCSTSCPGPGLADDVVVLAVRITGVRRDPIRLRRPARASELGSMRRLLVDWLLASGVASDEAALVAVAVSEAATNAIEHAYGAEDGWFELDAEIDRGHLDGRRARQRQVAAEGARRGRAGAGSDRSADGRVPGAPRRPRHRGVDAPRHRAGTLGVMKRWGA